MHTSHDKKEYHRHCVNFPVSIELANQQRAKGTAINIGQVASFFILIHLNTYKKLLISSIQTNNLG